ncbi:hypothetical protein H5410_038603 [Solanum commersonii]|uniref:Protein kinase domain-containing protein n=1 Tax=Solanum commersonii TaxID=4109 RepID=A0A9J5Y9F9_SOLCO|nr:hypothetical protein H5410_038603 [Solanum commersonii]
MFKKQIETPRKSPIFDGISTDDAHAPSFNILSQTPPSKTVQILATDGPSHSNFVGQTKKKKTKKATKVEVAETSKPYTRRKTKKDEPELPKSKKPKKMVKDVDFLDLEPILPGILTRFSYNELKIITQDFSRKLGKGGFGSVYEGTLSSGTKIAVKHLDGVGQVKESFLTEVKTVSGINHINLVKLIGYCAEKIHRLLIYEYMVNGSLDRWITQENGLTWHI